MLTEHSQEYKPAGKKAIQPEVIVIEG